MRTLEIGKYNQYARVWRFNVVKKMLHFGYNHKRYAHGENERCNNCKATYWQFWQNEEFPHYCPKCRCQLRSMFNGKYWDDDEEIPF